MKTGTIYVGNILRGNSVLFVTPEDEPQGLVLSAEALQGLSSGHRKATGPMMVPSAFAPWTSAALTPMAREARVVKAVVERISKVTRRCGLTLNESSDTPGETIRGLSAGCLTLERVLYRSSQG